MLPQIDGTRVPHSFWNSIVFEQVLEYYDGPRLLLQRSRAGQLYLAWWNDSEGPIDRWIYLPVSQFRLHEVLSGQLTVLEALNDPEDGDLLVTDVDVRENEVLQSLATTVSALPKDSLPLEGVRLDVPVPVFNDRPAREGTHQLDVRIHGEVGDTPAGVVGRFLSSIQGTLDAIGQVLTAVPTTQGPVPDSIRQQTRLNLVGTYAGSLGLRFETYVADGSAEVSIARDSLDWLFRLLESDQQFLHSDEYRDILSSRVARNYENLLAAIEATSQGTSIAWNQHGVAQVHELSITPMEAKYRRGAVETVNTEVLYLDGVFEAGNIRTGWFKFLAQGSSRSIGGRLTRRVVREYGSDHIPLGRPCSVEVESRHWINQATGEAKTTFTFRSVVFTDAL